MVVRGGQDEDVESEGDRDWYESENVVTSKADNQTGQVGTLEHPRQKNNLQQRMW